MESGRSMLLLLLLPRTHLLLLLHCCDQVQKYTRHHSPQSQGDVVVTAPGSGGLLDPTLGDKIYEIKHTSKQQRIERKKGRLYMNRERRAKQIVRIKTTESEQEIVGHCGTDTDDTDEEVDGHRKTCTGCGCTFGIVRSEPYDDTQRRLCQPCRRLAKQANTDVICYNCGEKGHISMNCRVGQKEDMLF